MDAWILGGIMSVVITLASAWMRHSSAKEIEKLRFDLGLDSGHDIERHKFRHQMGQFAAEARLNTHMQLGSLVAGAFRARFGSDWSDPNAKAAARTAFDEAKNYFYDHHYFFSKELDRAFRPMKATLEMEFPNSKIATGHLRDFINQIRSDLLLDRLAESASRAIGSGETSGATIVAP